MVNNTQVQQQKKTANALDRLEKLEQMFPQIVSAVNNSLSQVTAQLSGANEVLDAVVQALGTSTIEKLMVEGRQKKAQETSDAEKKALDEMLAANLVVVSAKISEKSIIVGHETDKDGKTKQPGRAQMAFSRIDTQFRPKFMDQGVGFELELPTGGKFFVDEIYDVVEKAPEALPAPTQAAPEVNQ